MGTGSHRRGPLFGGPDNDLEREREDGGQKKAEKKENPVYARLRCGLQAAVGKEEEEVLLASAPHRRCAVVFIYTYMYTETR